MNISFVDRPGGRLAFDDQGTGPLILTSPGMGDLRSSWRHLTGPLVDAGYRVVNADLRGHGASDATFAEYSDVATAADLIALAEHLGEPALLVGNSMSAGAAVIAAAERPELVTGLVLVGPFVRNPPTNPLMLALFRVLMAPVWARATWLNYLPTLYRGHRPDDFADYLAEVRAAMGRPGYARAFALTTRTSHAPAEAALARVTARSLVVMGELDPDFRDPAAEAAWIAEHLPAEVVMVPDAGHYPQSQQPETVAAAILAFAGAQR